MLMNNSKGNSKAKSLCYGVLIAVGLLVEAGVVAGAEQVAQPAQPQPQQPAQSPNDVIPKTRVPPEYPVDALRDRKEAWVQLQFSIDSEGKVFNAKVVDHCMHPAGEPKTCEKTELFDDPSLVALRRWTYEPGTPRDGVQTMMRYQLND